MSRHGGKRLDANSVLDAFERTGAAWLSAGMSFWGRASDVSAANTARNAFEAFRPSAGHESASERIDRLVDRYRQTLGDLALAIPLALREHRVQREEPVGEKLLFRAYSADPGGNNAETDPPILPLPPLGADVAVAWSQDHGQTLVDQVTRQVRVQRATIVSSLRNLGSADTAVARATHTELDGVVRSSLASVFGRTALSPLIAGDRLEQLARAVARKAASICRLSEAEIQVMHAAFASAGVSLSGSLSLVTERTRWVLCDHGHDRVYPIVPIDPADPEQLCEVYGAERGRSYDIPAAGGVRRVVLPARVHDAAQGMAVYTVPCDLVQPFIAPAFRQDFRLWNLGARQTAVALFLVDYRDTDLGSYFELGLACFLAPRDNPLAAGMHVISLAVNDAFSRTAGRVIWGYPKVLRPLDIRYTDDTATAALQRPDGKGGTVDVLRFAVRRGGEGASHAIPLFGYTQKQGQVNRVVFTRSGEGETFRSGRHAPRVSVLESSPDIDLVDQVVAMGLPDLQPRFTVWTERMSGEFGIPAVLLDEEDD